MEQKMFKRLKRQKNEFYASITYAYKSKNIKY